jgi:transposase-like protein
MLVKLGYWRSSEAGWMIRVKVMHFAHMSCPYCSSVQLSLRCKRARQDGSLAHQWLCRDCGKRFNERTATPLARLRTPVERVLKMRSEALVS